MYILHSEDNIAHALFSYFWINRIIIQYFKSTAQEISPVDVILRFCLLMYHIWENWHLTVECPCAHGVTWELGYLSDHKLLIQYKPSIIIAMFICYIRLVGIVPNLISIQKRKQQHNCCIEFKN